MSKYFAVLNSGSNEITAVVARWTKSGDYLLEGFCRVGSRGLKKGVVEDAAAATDSISAVLNNLKNRSGKNFTDVYAGISSYSIGIMPSHGVVLLSRYGREISDRDIKKCVKIGSTVKMPLDKEALHYVVEGFSVDGETSVKNPVTLEGVKLSAKMNIITISSSAARNLAKCISSAGFIPAGFVFSGLAASYRVLDGEDKEEGVILVDMDTDTTDALVFHDNVLSGCKVFPIGVNGLLSEDAGVDKARLSAMVSQIVSLPGWRKVHRAVITGRGAMADGLIENLEKSFNLPVEIGTCLVKPFEELPPERMRYLGNIGILDYLREEKLKERRHDSFIKRCFNKILAFMDRYF
jgi:cell division ATPase FtsA